MGKKTGAAFEVQYRGYTIIFNEGEKWETLLKGAKRPEMHENIKRVQDAIDRSLRGDFERLPVFIEKRNANGYGRSGRYEKATITSVGIDRDVFVQREGQKHTEAHSHYNGGLFVQNPANAQLIAELHAIQDEIETLESKRRQAAEKSSQKARKLQVVDTEKIVAKVLGPDA